jgi:hypothetical protein
MIRHFRRAVVAVSGAAVLVLGGASVASASVEPPTSPTQQAPTVDQVRDGTSTTPDYVVPNDRPQQSSPSAHRTKPGRTTPGRTTPATTPQTVSVPAPASRATAKAINLEFLQTCISCTSANAASKKAHGNATAIRLLGHDISWGESVSDGSHDGALLALPINPLLNLAIADWKTVSHADGGDSTKSFSHDRAALVDLALLGDSPAESLLTVAILESMSNATYSDALSHGDATANGVDLTALKGALVIIVLHSETSSDHPGSSYLLSINGNKLGEAGEDGIPITIPGVLTITLLQVGAVGGVGSAVIGTVTMPGGGPESAGVVTAQSSGAAAVVPAATTPVTGGVAGAAAAVVPKTAASVSAVAAPSTGVNMGVGGLLLVVTGAAVAVMALRRRRAGNH